VRQPFPPAPDGTDLRTWVRHDPGRGETVTFVEPEGRYQLSVERDGPVPGYLVRLWTLTAEGRDERIGQAVVGDEETAIRVAAGLAGATEDLAALTSDPAFGVTPSPRGDRDADADTGGRED
jgi:hypothetical protein